MEGRILFHAFVSLAIAFPFVSATTTLRPGVDKFVFGLQWPGAYCAMNSCCYTESHKPHANFTIRGLWAVMKDGTMPDNCEAAVAYSPSETSEFARELREVWGPYTCEFDSPDELWTEMWENFGSCGFNQPRKYFKMALHMHKSMDLLAWLRHYGVRPNGGIYSVSKVRQAIQESFGQKALLECTPISWPRVPLLNNIYVCFGKDGKPIDCPPRTAVSVPCYSWVRFAPLSV